jgi:penicillin-binding protein 2
MYVIQLYTPWTLDETQAPVRLITRRTTVNAARGNIYDRNGVLLASGRPSYNIMIDWWALRASPNANDIVKELVYAAMDEGLTYTDTFPVTRGAPFEYLTNMSSVQRNRLEAYFEFHNIDPEISVSELLAWMRNHYKIDFTVGILDARLIIGVRYELEIRAIVRTISPYIFSADVDTDFVSYLEERGLSGVYADSNFVREYHTTSAAHLIGYTGAMTADEFERFRELGYPMDAIVGKVGAEAAFEEYLHGSNGEKTTMFTHNGTVVRNEVTKEPIPGQHVHLTIDLGLQIATENGLRTQIERINNLREIERIKNEEDEDDSIPGGAAVVINVNTGEVLAAASFPTFNLATLSENWAFLQTDPAFPMLNRATQGRYSPGSTFKMVTALAGLRHNVITRYYPIEDTGRYMVYDDFTPACWVYSRHGVGHGWVDVVQALECSCNYFFLAVSDWFPGGHRAGAQILADTAQEFGLGRSTGLEIPEFAGRLAVPEVKAILRPDQGWWNADTLQAGFGQGYNRFTPIQLANYAATIANGGTLYSLSLLRRITSSDFTEVLKTHEPEVLNVIEETEYIEIIQEGMLAASRGNRGTASDVFRNYQIAVASKTGTVQVEGQRANDGAFVCYAPADNPEIAIALVVEKGGSGSAIMDIARIIFDHYFMTEDTFLVQPYGEMIP